MDVLRQYLWLWVLGAIGLASLIISVIFILINRCIAKSDKQNITQVKRNPNFSVESNKYQQRSEANPPLPPRMQVLGEGAPSYENLAEEPKYEQTTSAYQIPISSFKSNVKSVKDSKNLAEEHHYEVSTADYQQNPDNQPDYVEVEDEAALQPPAPFYQLPHSSFKPVVKSVQSNDNLVEEHDYEESNLVEEHDYEESNLVEEHNYEESTADYLQNLDMEPDCVEVEEEANMLPPLGLTGTADNSSEDYDDIGEEEDEDYDDVG